MGPPVDNSSAMIPSGGSVLLEILNTYKNILYAEYGGNHNYYIDILKAIDLYQDTAMYN